MNDILASRPAIAATPRIPSQLEVCGATITTKFLFAYSSPILPRTFHPKQDKRDLPSHLINHGLCALKL